MVTVDPTCSYYISRLFRVVCQNPICLVLLFILIFTMDIEKLVNCVQERGPLWDLSSKLYNNRDISRKLWAEVGQELNVTGDEAKSKWRGMRDIFRREFQKVGQKRSGDAGEEQNKPKWAHFESMMFLKDVMGSRKSDGNICPPLDDSIEDNRLSQHSEEEMLTDPSISQDNSQASGNTFTEPSQTNQRTKMGRKVSSVMKRSDVYDKMIALKKMIALEEEKLSLYRRNSDLKDDSDYHFLMSLLPYMKQVLPERKMYFRMKLQEVFLNEEEYQRCSSPAHSSLSEPLSQHYPVLDIKTESQH